MRSSALPIALALAGLVSAHPGHDVNEELMERRAFKNAVRQSSLAHCAETLKARGVEARNVQRRAALVEEARALKGIFKRDADEVLGQSHNETDLGYTENTPASDLFSGNASCVLTPEVTQGPYYVGGEYIRKNIVEEQEGVGIILDYQVIDVDTCEPVPEVYLEMWHCNSTGVYSGVVASGNGDSSDETNINNTFLRGIQKTDEDGVAQFESLFPGHYTGRATHIHVMVHTNATEYANQTLGNLVYSSHVGQAFFDQDLIAEVDLIEPYAANTQELTLNADDSILSEEAATEGVDPLMSYTLLGDSISDGLFAWLAFGINTTLSEEVQPAVFYYESGGVENANSGGGGGGDGAPPGDAPPGASFSGSMSAPAETADVSASTELGSSATASVTATSSAASGGPSGVPGGGSPCVARPRDDSDS